MRRRGPALLWTTTLLLACSTEAREPRPNVLFLIADDQAAGTLSCEGHPVVETPHIDLIAEGGARFANAFVTTAMCSASRASFLTGRYGRAHDVLRNRGSIRVGVPTFPELFTAAGWDTAYIGKWHVDGKQTGRLPGFSHSCVLPVQGSYRDPRYYRDGEVLETEGFVDDLTTDFAIEFLRREREGPFLLCVGFKSTHRPRDPADRFDELFADATFEPPPSMESFPPFPRRPEWVEMSRSAGHLVDDETPAADWAEAFGERRSLKELTEKRDEAMREYLRLVAGIDENVGRLLDVLDELGATDDTIVVYTSDHGYLHGEHGMGGKAVAYEEAIRTLLLVRDPRIEGSGRIVQRMALNIDVAPTLLDLAGLPIPPGVQGRSLRPLLEGREEPWREAFLYEFYRSPMYGGVPTVIAVREERWKLITYPGYPEWSQLFDLETDPREMRDLARDPEHAAERERLERRLREVESRIGERPDG